MKAVITLILALLTGLLVQGQSLERQVIGSNGQSVENGSGGLSFTTGEVVVMSAVQQDVQLTQGFQQSPSTGTSSVVELNNARTDLSVFPNPASDHLSIDGDLSREGITELSYTIMDMHGKVVQSGTVQLNSGSISLTDLAASGYVLRLYDEQHGYDQRMRFVKI